MKQTKYYWLIICCWLLILPVAYAQSNVLATATQQVATTQTTTKVNFGPVFVGVSDAMGMVKQGDDTKAKAILSETLTHFMGLPIPEDALKKEVITAFLLSIDAPNTQNLSALSTQLYALEKQQNPVDYRAKRANFGKKILPALSALDKSIQDFDGSSQSLEQVKQSYDVFNRAWVANERVVRNTDKTHYGKIETSMALVRVAIESSPANKNQMLVHLHELKAAVDSYNRGDKLQAVSQQVDLAYGVALLQSGLEAFVANDMAAGQAKLGEFIQIWPSIEGDVATANPALYAKIESQVPVVMANGNEPKQQQNLQVLIDELRTISPDVRYGVVDAMLILLREGLEALLIVMALLTAMKAAGQSQGKRYIYAGVAAGLMASVAGAVALQQLFPAMTSGANREILEGLVGVFAVVMMLGVGVWLHSKSSVKAWNAYINKHTTVALSTGSFVGLFGLSFLSVFREGAETILFYVGILPKIAMSDFVLGIILALLLLVMVAVILAKTSLRLPIPTLFKVLTLLIYGLGFKILGVSIHALQLTKILPMTSVALPAVPMLGIYPTVQGLLAQAVFIALVCMFWLVNKTRT